MAFRQLITLFLLVSSPGCVTTIESVPLPQTEVAALNGKELGIVQRVMPHFRAVTRSNMTGTAILPIVGPFISDELNKATGKAIILAGDIGDPAYAIAEALARALEEKYGIKYAGIGSSIVNDDDSVQLVASAYSKFDLVLDLKTVKWGLVYPWVFTDEYKFFYIGRMQIIDTAGSSVMAEGACTSLPTTPDSVFPYEKLLEKGAAQLREEIEKAVNFCIKEFSEKFLGM